MDSGQWWFAATRHLDKEAAMNGEPTRTSFVTKRRWEARHRGARGCWSVAVDVAAGYGCRSRCWAFLGLALSIATCSSVA